MYYLHTNKSIKKPIRLRFNRTITSFSYEDEPATTTAMITGAVCTELFKFVQGMNTIGKFKNSFINLALPSVMFTEPDDVKKIVSKDYDPILGGAVEAVPSEYTVFDKTVVKEGSMTV